MADTTALIQYYQDSLLQQWANNDPNALKPTPKARATIGALVDCAICDLVMHDTRDAFDLATAVGDQLDMIGEYIGLTRTAYGVIDRNYFQADDYTAPDYTLTGMTDYTDPVLNATSVTYRYAYILEAEYQLDDEAYRFLLFLKRDLNHSDNTLKDIQDTLWLNLGADIRMFDAADMTIGYYMATSAGRFSRLAASQNLLPKPMGVGTSGVFEVLDPYDHPAFGLEDSDKTVFNAENTRSFSNIDVLVPTMTSCTVTYASGAGKYGASVSLDSTGTIAHVLQGSTLRQFTLASAWDMTTATSAAAKVISTGISRHCFSSDGLKLIYLGDQDGTVYQRTLTSAWDINTLATSGSSVSIGTGGDQRGFWLSEDGYSFYTINIGDVQRFRMSTAFDVTTAVADANLFEIIETGPSSLLPMWGATEIMFDKSGRRMFLATYAPNGTYNDGYEDRYYYDYYYICYDLNVEWRPETALVSNEPINYVYIGRTPAGETGQALGAYLGKQDGGATAYMYTTKVVDYVGYSARFSLPTVTVTAHGPHFLSTDDEL